MDAIVARQDNHHKTSQTERLHSKVIYITGVDIQGEHELWPQSAGCAESAESEFYAYST